MALKVKQTRVIEGQQEGREEEEREMLWRW